MKIEQLRIRNFKGVENLEITFNNDVTRFIGLNGSGKTTIFEAIWAGFKGISEKDQGGNIIGDRYHFIGSKDRTAKIDIFVKDEKRTISVTTTIGKSGNSMEFYDENGLSIDGYWVKNLLDVTMMNAVQFCKLTPKQQAVRLGIDLTKFNERSAALKEQFTEYNSVYRTFGNLEPVEECQRVSLNELIKEKAEIKLRLNDEFLKNQAHNEMLRKEYKEAQESADLSVDEHNIEQERRLIVIKVCNDALECLNDNGYSGKEVEQFINSLLKPEPVASYVALPVPKFINEIPDDSDLKAVDKKIEDSARINEKAALYEAYISKKKDKDRYEHLMMMNKTEQLKLDAEKLEYIKSFQFGFDGLEVDESGGLILNGRAISTYSQAETEIIVARLAESLNPEFKVRMIDEFQSLDQGNQEKLINELLENGFQLLIAEVGDPGIKKDKNAVFLRECKIVDGKEVAQQKKLL